MSWRIEIASTALYGSFPGNGYYHSSPVASVMDYKALLNDVVVTQSLFSV